jgi:TPR repeat protein
LAFCSNIPNFENDQASDKYQIPLIQEPYDPRLKDLVFRMIKKDPKQRITIEEILSIDFLQEYLNEKPQFLFEEGLKQLHLNKPQEACLSFKKSANFGHIDASYMLGLAYYQGWAAGINLNISSQYFKQVVLSSTQSQYYIDACYFYDYSLYFGWNGASNIQESLSYLNIAAQNGHSLAKNDYSALTYLLNPQEGSSLLAEAESSNQNSSLVNFACALLQEGQENKSLPLFWQASQNGHTQSLCEVGWLIHKQNPVEAMNKFKLAMERNNTNGMVSYAMGLEKGFLGNVDLPQAVQLYFDAYQKGNIYGQIRYAKCLMEGIGISQNINEGRRLLELASIQGNQYAAALLKEYQMNRISP